MDLFTAFTDTPEQAREKHFEEMLGDAMKKQWAEDQRTVKAQGRIGDWVGEPQPLSKDKARLLSLLYDVGSIYWTSTQSQNNRNVTKAMGLNNTANARAVIDQCHAAGLIDSQIYRGHVTFTMAQDGEYALEEYEIEVELGLISL